MKRILVALLKAYKAGISPYMGRSCRYSPTCSEYTIQAIEKFGARRGVIMGAKRVLRCHPFVRGGYDPVKQ